MTLYRPHCGLLDESMEEVAEVKDFADLVRHIRAKCPGFYPDDERPTTDNTEVKPYGRDDRIAWDTYIVVVNGNAWGFTNGPLPK